MQEKSLIKQNILLYLEFKNVSKYRFYKDSGITRGVLDQNTGMSEENTAKFLAYAPDCNPTWLLTGNGEMLLSNNNGSIKSFTLRTDNNISDQCIPIYNLEATAGLVNLFQNQNDTKPIDHLRIPNLPKCDGAVFVTGDSMYPLLKSGDIVAYKEIKDLPNEIFWGEMYIVSVEVAGEEFVSVKYVQKSELGIEYITLVSHNQHHAPKNVHLNKVRAMAMVKASVRINSMS